MHTALWGAKTIPPPSVKSFAYTGNRPIQQDSQVLNYGPAFLAQPIDLTTRPSL